MRRSEFLSSLIALPFVGSLLGHKPEPARPTDEVVTSGLAQINDGYEWTGVTTTTSCGTGWLVNGTCVSGNGVSYIDLGDHVQSTFTS